MRRVLCLLLFHVSLATLHAQNGSPFNEIIYGRKDGVALTMLHFKPTATSNSKAIIWVVAGAWNSSYNQATTPGAISDVRTMYTDRGFTVFEVIVGSQQRFAIPEQVEDVKRAVRYIRYNAKTFGIDPAHLGITGYSAGGHLSLAVAMADEKINNAARDEVDRVSSRVQAAAVLFPPVDFLNWDGRGFNLLNVIEFQKRYQVSGAFDFRRWSDSTRSYEAISDTSTRNKIGRDISPVYAVSPDDPPIFIIHGDADQLVPLYQSESIAAKLKQQGVTHQFVIKKGGRHIPNDMQPELNQFPAWFDKYLK